MDLAEYKSKQARQLAKLLAIALDAKQISQETVDAGLHVAQFMEQEHRSKRPTPKPLQSLEADAREKFARLFDRDTAPKKGDR